MKNAVDGLLFELASYYKLDINRLTFTNKGHISCCMQVEILPNRDLGVAAAIYSNGYTNIYLSPKRIEQLLDDVMKKLPNCTISEDDINEQQLFMPICLAYFTLAQREQIGDIGDYRLAMDLATLLHFKQKVILKRANKIAEKILILPDEPQYAKLFVCARKIFSYIYCNY